jgi:hypothetical protein
MVQQNSQKLPPTYAEKNRVPAVPARQTSRLMNETFARYNEGIKKLGF